jgi:hypothetical protein
MAKLTVKGFDELEKRLQNIEHGLRGEAMVNMLYAGAAVLEDAWRGEIATRHRLTGEMEKSVGRSPVNVGPDGLEISVYPMGTDNHRITNAQKAYILHYGRQATHKGTKAIKGDKFVTEAEKKAKPKVYEAMQQALNDYISGKE